MSVRANADLLAVSAAYFDAQLPLTIARRYPFLYRLWKAKKGSEILGQSTNVRCAVSTQNAANPWTSVASTFNAQITPGTYYNSVPAYTQYVMSQHQLPWAYTAEQKRTFDRSNDEGKARVLEVITKEALAYYARYIAAFVGGAGGATNQTATAIMSLNWMCDAANSVGGIAPATGHAARNVANFSFTMRNLKRELNLLSEERVADTSCILVSTNSGGNDLLGKGADWILNVTDVDNTENMPNLGKPDYKLYNLPVFGFSELPASEMYLLDESELNLMLPETPDKTGEYVIPGTAATAQTMFVFGGMFPGSVRKQGRYTAVS